jgi:hypothetical protein
MWFSKPQQPAPPALQPLFLFGGLDAGQLWPLTNLVLPAWLLLVVLPTWRYTPMLTLFPPLLHSALYAMVVISSLLNAPVGDAGPDFSTLDGIITMFQDPTVVFAGWVHYLVFDLLIGRAIAQDALSRRWTPIRHALLVVPCLGLILMLGPCGFLLYSGIAASGLLGAPQVDDRELELRLQRLKPAPRSKDA